jgi:hypothetical protein
MIADKIVGLSKNLQLRDNISVLGVYLTGSHAIGTPLEHSDVDLLAITSADERYRCVYPQDGYNVDLFVLSERFVLSAISGGRGDLLTMLTDAVILSDCSARLAAIRSAAKRRFEEGPILDSRHVEFVRHRLVTILDDCADCLNHAPSTAIIMMVSQLKVLSDLYLCARHCWDAPYKNLVPTLAKYDVQLATWFEIVASQGVDVETRFQAFREIVDRVLEPFGGTLRYFERDFRPPKPRI